MNIAIIGHQNITGFVIKELIDKGFKINHLIGLNKKNSGSVTDFLDLTKIAKTHGINLYNPNNYDLKDERSTQFFEEEKFDILIVVGWSRLIPDKILNSVKYSTLGWHGGMFKPPRCRGRAVVNWCLINGHNKFYIYTMNLKPGIDDGDIYDLEEIEVSDDDTSKTLYFKCGISLVNLFSSTLKNFKNLTPKEQIYEGATYLPKRNKENGGIDWSKNSNETLNLIRGLSDPFPNAFSEVNNARVYFKSAQIFDIQTEQELLPGKIYHVFHDSTFSVACKDKLIYISSFSSESNFVPKNGLVFDMVSGQTLEAEGY